MRIVWIVMICVLVLITIGNIYAYDKGERYIVQSSDDISRSQAQAAIILGAGVTLKGTPSSVLQDRILAAISLYNEGKVFKILVSGSNSEVENNEVNPVKKVLMQNGIPERDIFLDHAGFDTYSTMYRAHSVFKVDSAIIVTQEFHLPRAVYLARSLGINAYGMAADRGTYSIKNYIRELLARPLAVFDVLRGRVPKYLGPAIPITGDGSIT